MIERVKTVLMRRYRLTEPEAYRLLRRQAMDGGRRIVNVARDIVATAQETPDAG